MNFDSAQLASSVIGCEGEELQTAVFKHHLRQLLQKATGGSSGRHIPEGTEESESVGLWQEAVVCYGNYGNDPIYTCVSLHVS